MSDTKPIESKPATPGPNIAEPPKSLPVIHSEAPNANATHIPEIKTGMKTPDPERDLEELEKAASGKLRLAKQLLYSNRDAAKRRLESITKDYSDTPSAREAAELLKKL